MLSRFAGANCSHIYIKIILSPCLAWIHASREAKSKKPWNEIPE